MGAEQPSHRQLGQCQCPGAVMRGELLVAYVGNAGWFGRETPNLAPVALVESGIAAAACGDWSARLQGRWCYASPVGAAVPGQGWKLHLSGTPDSVLDLLAAALPVLLPERCAFKVAAGLDDARWLSSARCP